MISLFLFTSLSSRTHTIEISLLTHTQPIDKHDQQANKKMNAHVYHQLRTTWCWSHMNTMPGEEPISSDKGRTVWKKKADQRRIQSKVPNELWVGREKKSDDLFVVFNWVSNMTGFMDNNSADPPHRSPPKADYCCGLGSKLFRLKNIEGLQDTEENADESQLKVKWNNRETKITFNCGSNHDELRISRKFLERRTSSPLALVRASERECTSSRVWSPRKALGRPLSSVTWLLEWQPCCQVRTLFLQSRL